MATMTDEDLAKAMKLFENVSNSMTAVSKVVQSIFSQLADDRLPTKKGHSLLELKNQTMLNYVINLIHLIYEKISGNSIEGFPGIERIVELRTVLEKLLPLEKKLKNDFDRKVKAAVTGVVDHNDPMSFKPNPQSLLSESEDESSAKSEEEEQEEEQSEPDTSVYRPSKTLPTYFDESAEKKRARLEERSRQRLLKSEMVKDFARQYTDAPEEILESNRRNKNRQAERRELERTEYEETYLTRLPPEKKTSSKKRKTYLKKKGSKRRRTH